MPTYNSQSRKRYTLRLLLMCLEELMEGFSCCRGRDGERVCWKLLSLLKLYQRFWIWNVDQNLNMVKSCKTNRGWLHFAILKVLHGFEEKKSLQGKRYVIFSSNCWKWDFPDFENVLKEQHETDQGNLLNWFKNKQQI